LLELDSNIRKIITASLALTGNLRQIALKTEGFNLY
jgi:hypothetical protein